MRRRISGMHALGSEIAQTAARMVVAEGLEYGPAKRRALREMGLPARTALPPNDLVERAVVEYIALFCASTQADELLALRRLAALWMQRMSAFRPYLSGAVWQGTATRRSDIHIELFCDDCKSAEMALIDHHVAYEARMVGGTHGERVDVLSVHAYCEELNEDIGVHLSIYDYRDLRGALRPDASARAPRGDLAAVRSLLRDGTA